MNNYKTEHSLLTWIRIEISGQWNIVKSQNEIKFLINSREQYILTGPEVM